MSKTILTAIQTQVSHRLAGLVIGCGALFGVSPAFAGAFTPPAGCTGWLTVQARACRVSNYYKCSQDAPGDQWRADFDQEGLFFASRIDAEAQWVESLEFNPSVRQTLDPGAEDPASFTELLNGVDTFAFNLSRDDGGSSKVRGFDRLSGRTVQIDGVSLLETSFEYTEIDASGTVTNRSHGNEYIHPEWRLFFAGPSQTDLGTGDLPIDGSPVEFIFPGEPGFFSTRPVFECDAVLSSYSKGNSDGN
ncbi:hypothetical protein [Pseudorhodobacter sp.]|uniref:hypothetical protein n=1 Tax=Pseudorhodobacter sp. TaxID=1934400 RepID=UPI0026478729|nr:hypothetical protein [Pseudorhodobacter sp.]MDN5788691.1 hypothetical protein [Pseudorhodobacter sp.]